jgi:hypothetical protein
MIHKFNYFSDFAISFADGGRRLFPSLDFEKIAEVIFN